MFTFSMGFEAATLKIPNKEYTAYSGVGVGGTTSTTSAGVGGGASAATRGSSSTFGGYSGPNDPYNLVTVHQGGVVVDTGRDGLIATAWDTNNANAAAVGGGNDSQGGAAGQQSRKQIIGFAKFRTRSEALEARDQLQGRRVDIEKGAILKAEMAKKNLHTKRGVAGAHGGALGALGESSSAGSGGLNGSLPTAGAGAGADVERERQGGALAAMGFGGLGSIAGGLQQQQQQQQAQQAQQQWETRGARERAEEEERRRRKADKEARLRVWDSGAFEHFREAIGRGQSQQQSQQQEFVEEAGPWDSNGYTNVNGLATLGQRRMTNGSVHAQPISSGLPARPPSGSPPGLGGAPHHQTSPPPPSYPAADSTPMRPRSESETSDDHTPVVEGAADPSAEELAKRLAAVNVSEDSGARQHQEKEKVQGDASPELPSPSSGSGGSGSGESGNSAGFKSGVDQNPPVSLLCVIYAPCNGN